MFGSAVTALTPFSTPIPINDVKAGSRSQITSRALEIDPCTVGRERRLANGNSLQHEDSLCIARKQPAASWGLRAAHRHESALLHQRVTVRRSSFCNSVS